jgi:Protein of unknown function (DUF4038)/Domain of unknown function (DUF5060)/Putative collagen-binding domain of a collagenase
MMRNIFFTWSRLVVACLFLLPAAVREAAASAEMAMVTKWGRFEQSFKSPVLYSNAVQDAALQVVFTSPLGDTYQVDGFWDGGATWRVRFSPDLPGRWKFKTTCSDAANWGLNGQSGQFLCMAATGPTRFEKHGQVRVALDHRHLEHLDGTPFFWLADTAWNGARRAEIEDWESYAGIRTAHLFTVAQWSVAPGEDTKNQSAYSGFPSRIAINPDFFKRLDARLDVLSQAGILSAIVPLLELPPEMGAAEPLPDRQAELLTRYVVARWGAEPVAWLLAFEGDSAGKNAARWKHIGQAVFGGRAHAPVVLFTGDTPRVLDEFRDQPWVDVFGYRTVTGVTDDALAQTFTGPFPAEWKKEPTRPLIPFTPYENGVVSKSTKRYSSDDVRHAAYWSLLLAPPAGLSYGGEGVVDWDMSVGPGIENPKPSDLPMWRKALFMPAAKQMSHLALFMNSMDFWKLRPDQKAVASQPGQTSPQRFIAAAENEDKTLALVYVPEDRNLDLLLDALPHSPAVSWFNPRTGGGNPAVAVAGASSYQFPTPAPGDWLLEVKAGK